MVRCFQPLLLWFDWLHNRHMSTHSAGYMHRPTYSFWPPVLLHHICTWPSFRDAILPLWWNRKPFDDHRAAVRRAVTWAGTSGQAGGRVFGRDALQHVQKWSVFSRSVLTLERIIILHCKRLWLVLFFCFFKWKCRTDIKALLTFWSVDCANLAKSNCTFFKKCSCSFKYICTVYILSRLKQ